MKKFFIAAFLAVFFLNNMEFYPIHAYVMGSGNFRIQSDSLNIGGGHWGSANYIFEDTTGEIASGLSSSASYGLKAGYQQMQEVYLSVSSPLDVLLASSIPGVTGNPGAPASGSATWTIKTDSPSGFNMKIKASADPAMQNTDGEYFFSDYTSAAAGSPDYNWASPAVGSAEFGYSVTAATATDADTPFRNDGAQCGTGNNNNDNQCWWDFETSDTTIINRNSGTSSLGEDEKVNFRAESNGRFLKEGYYDAVIIITVVPN